MKTDVQEILSRNLQAEKPPRAIFVFSLYSFD